MKKTILTTMLFFAFLLAGIQNANAQSSDVAAETTIQFVGSADAMSMLVVEIQDVENDPVYSGNQEQHPTYSDLVLRLNFYTAVYEGILLGETIPASIQVGVVESDVPDEEIAQKINPIKEEVEQLLKQ